MQLNNNNNDIDLQNDDVSSLNLFSSLYFNFEIALAIWFWLNDELFW